MLNNELDRISGKIAYDVTPKDWLKLGVNLMVNDVKDTEFEEGGGGQTPRRTMIEMPPIFPVKFPDGTWSNSQMISDAYNLESMSNPVHVLETQERFWERNQLFGNFYANFNCVFLDSAPITIGDDVMLGPGVHIYTVDHPRNAEARRAGGCIAKPVNIGSGVWVGGGAKILPGVIIGENAIIGSNVVVTKNVASNSKFLG